MDLLKLRLPKKLIFTIFDFLDIKDLVGKGARFLVRKYYKYYFRQSKDPFIANLNKPST